MHRTHVVLTQVDPFSSNGQGDIHSIIDDQWHIMSLSDFMQLFGCGDKLPSIALLVAILNNGNSCGVPKE